MPKKCSIIAMPTCFKGVDQDQTPEGGSCLMCELPLTPSAICFGCIPCYSFVHEHCLDLPLEIRHPVHPAHSLRRLDFTHTCGTGKSCDACKRHIDGVPLGCSECDFNLHLRCADSLLRSLMHKDHHHKLFYIADNFDTFDSITVCGICKDSDGFYYKSHYLCVECSWRVHLECLEMPKSVLKKSYHIHPLMCEKFLPEDEDSLEHCGVCETKVHNGHHAYCCKECDFVSHIECILHELLYMLYEVHSPLYLKDLYICGENIRRPSDQNSECETKDLENKIVLNDIRHNHVLVLGDIKEIHISCNICWHRIYNDTVRWKCEACSFVAHDYCVNLKLESRYRFHLKHPLTLLPSYPVGTKQNCDICKTKVYFNLFCRICNFMICTRCVVRARKSSGDLQRGLKFIRFKEEKCLSKEHDMVQVMVSSSSEVACTICNDVLYGSIRSCMECEEIYHSLCIERGKELLGHKLHYDHTLQLEVKRGYSKCNACKLDIFTKYCYFCSICSVSFHFKCIKAVGFRRQHCDQHYLYNFWRGDSSSAQPCTVCKRPCGASFYGCNTCDFKAAHLECIGFPNYVKNHRHKHAVKLTRSYRSSDCSLCGIVITELDKYLCRPCKEVYHAKCIMSKVEREAATEEDQLSDIRRMYIEVELFKKMELGKI